MPMLFNRSGVKMPRYIFSCFSCGAKDEKICPIAERNNDVPVCQNCGGHMERDYNAQAPMINNRPYSKPLHSDSLAINPSQIAEHRKRFPGVEIDGQCRPVFTNAAQHDKYMDKCGVQKLPQRIKRRGKVIAKLGKDNYGEKAKSKESGKSSN